MSINNASIIKDQNNLNSHGKYKALEQTDEDKSSTRSLPKKNPIYIITMIIIILSCIFLLFLNDRNGNHCGEISVYQTTSDGSYSLTLMPSNYASCMSSSSSSGGGGKSNQNHFLKSSMSSTSQIKINKSQIRQSIIGFGGAFTEAASINFASLSHIDQQKILQLYWGIDGAGYTIGRIPIGSCDFSISSYSFDDVDGDYDLKYFDNQVLHDQIAIIPFIKQAIATSVSSGLGNIKLFGSPWSPPDWLKSKKNGIQSMDGSSSRGGLLQTNRARNTWANYLSKWITAYEYQGFDMWGLTVQNEPEFAAPWESCKFNASSEASFVREHLGPIIRKEHPNVKIMAFDHNKDHLEAWSSTMFSSLHDGASQYIDGMAFHWYAGGMDRLQDGIFGHHFISKTYEILKTLTSKNNLKLSENNNDNNDNHNDNDNNDNDNDNNNNDNNDINNDEEKKKKSVPFLLGTEACSCSGTAEIGSSLSWIRSERYAHDILNDLANYANGWMDWNLVLNHEGGPNHLGNLCDAPILTKKDYSGIIIQPYLSTISHFTKYLVPNTVMVNIEISSSFISNSNSEEQEKEIHHQNPKSLQYGGVTRMPSGATLSLWPCDYSSRQRYNKIIFNNDISNNDTSIATSKLIVENVQYLSDVGIEPEIEGDPDKILTLCISNVNNAVGGNSAQVVDCDADEWVGRFSYDEDTGYIQLLNPIKTDTDDLETKDDSSSICLGAPLKYANLMREGGAPLSLAPCEEVITTNNNTNSDSSKQEHDQKWVWDSTLSSYYQVRSSSSDEKHQCLTVGWPFVQGIAGITPSDETIVIVVNEAAVPVSVSISLNNQMDADVEIQGEIPPKSIQTYVVK